MVSQSFAAAAGLVWHVGSPRLTPETMAFSGCSITSGVGKGLVVDTGMSTRSLHCKQ